MHFTESKQVLTLQDSNLKTLTYGAYMKRLIFVISLFLWTSSFANSSDDITIVAVRTITETQISNSDQISHSLEKLLEFAKEQNRIPKSAKLLKTELGPQLLSIPSAENLDLTKILIDSGIKKVSTQFTITSKELYSVRTGKTNLAILDYKLSDYTYEHGLNIKKIMSDFKSVGQIRGIGRELMFLIAPKQMDAFRTAAKFHKLFSVAELGLSPGTCRMIFK